MKKSSFLQKPKDMLSKSFNPAKCKTALKLAASRMKLMKNKKEVQVKQMKRELAGLLESGQDQTARIRVEHVIREEKMMAAYDLIDIYCELTVARLPIIESQKNCPIDLKEAIASIIFASPRCGDIPELLDARKHFTAKYGKDFATAAVELRPNCGVSRLLVEKLSANAPDGQTKIKALTAIAEEHNIKWEQKSFGQSDVLPPDDLLNGPSTFEKSSAVHAEAHPHAIPEFQAPPSHHMMDNQPVNVPERNSRSHGNQNLASRDNTLSSDRVSSTPQDQMRPSGVGAVRGEVGHSFQKERNSYSTGQSWEMEFQDATSAAQAAAESAERASIAARAAAELSSFGRPATHPQYPSEIHNSTGDARRHERTARHRSSKYKSDNLLNDYPSEIHSSTGDARRHERTARHGSSKYRSDDLPNDSANGSFYNGQPRSQNRPMDEIKDDDESLSVKSYGDGHDYGKRYGGSASSRSKASFNIDTSARNDQIPPDGNWYRRSSNEEENKVQRSMQKQSGKSQIEGMSHQQGALSSEYFDYSEKGRTSKQSSNLSSSPRSSISSTDEKYSNFGHSIFNYDAGTEYSVHNDPQKTTGDTIQPSHNVSSAPLVFDDSGSETEDFGFDKGFQIDEESNYQFASPGSGAPPGWGAPPNFSSDTRTENHEYETSKSLRSSISEFSVKKHSYPEFSESSEAPLDGSLAENFGAATFDDSDSESETDMSQILSHGTVDFRDLSTEQNNSLGFSESVVVSTEKFGFGDSPASQSSISHGKSGQDSIVSGSKSDFDNTVNNVGISHSLARQMDDESSDDGMELSLKKLTGGFRQKGYMRPPYTRSQVDDTSSSPKASTASPNMISQSTAYSTADSFADRGLGRSSRLSTDHSDTESDSSVEELRKQPPIRRQDPNIEHPGNKEKKQPSLRSSVTYFDSDSSGESEDDYAQEAIKGRSSLGSGISRRTKAPPSTSTSVSNSDGRSSSRMPVNLDSSAERNPKSIHDTETPRESHRQARNLDQLADSRRRSSSKAVSNPSVMSNMGNRNSSGVEQLRSSKQKLQTSQPQTRYTDHSGNPEPPNSAKLASNSSLVSKISLPEEKRKSSGLEQPSSSERKSKTSDATESQRTASVGTVSREDSLKKASHVHPKLPDYDSFVAKFEALRTERH